MVTGPSRVTFVRSPGVDSKGRSNSSISRKAGPAGGEYVTEVIDGKAFTYFVPSNVKIYKGSKGGKYGVESGAEKVVDTTTTKIGNMTVKETPTPAQAQQARAQEIQKAALEGRRLTSQQQKELYQSQQAKQRVEVYVDYAGAEKFNRDLASIGINNAGEFIDAVKTGKIREQNGVYTLTKPKTQEKTFSGEVHAGKFYNERPGLFDFTKNELYKFGESKLNLVRTEKGDQFFNQELGAVSTTAGGFLEGVESVPKNLWTLKDPALAAMFGFEILKATAPVNPKSPFFFSGKTIYKGLEVAGATAAVWYGKQSIEYVFDPKIQEYPNPEFEFNRRVGIVAGSVGTYSAFSSFLQKARSGYDFMQERNVKGAIVMEAKSANKEPYTFVMPRNSRDTSSGFVVNDEGLGIVPSTIQTQLFPKSYDPGLPNDVFTSNPVKIDYYPSETSLMRSRVTSNRALDNWLPKSGYDNSGPVKIIEDKPGAYDALIQIRLQQKTNPEKFTIQTRIEDWQPKVLEGGDYLMPGGEVVNPFVYPVKLEAPKVSAKFQLFSNKKGSGLLSPETIFDNTVKVYERPKGEVFKDYKTEGLEVSRIEYDLTVGETSKFGSVYFGLSAQNPNTTKALNDISSEEEVKIFSIPAIKGETSSKQATKIFYDVSRDQKIDTTITSKQIFTPQIPKPINTPRPQQKQPTKPQSPFVPPTLPKKSSKKISLGYDVFLKRRGVFKRVNQNPLPKNQAFNFGSYKTETTSAATFKVTPSNRAGLKFYNGPSGSPGNFYRKGNVFIEKRNRRINTFGELREITFKNPKSIFKFGRSKK